MKIVIVGAGVVGLHLAKTLSWQEHQVTIIESNRGLVDRASGNLDVLAVTGSGTSINTLLEAGTPDADLLIAVTSIDEVNILACVLAKQLGTKTRIARIRNQEYSSKDIPISLEELGIDQIIHPELEAAREVERMIRYQHAYEVVDCADGEMSIVGIEIQAGSKLVDVPLEKLTPQFPEISVRVVAIKRGEETIFPSGKNSLKVGDLIYISTHRDNLGKVFNLANVSTEGSRDVMLLGGDLVSRLVAERLEKTKSYNIKLIENDETLSRIAAETLNRTMVVRGNEEMDIDMMVIEGLDKMGVFAALSDDDENNIVTSLFARHMKVNKTITLISKPEYTPIARAIGLDATVNELLLTSDAILKHLSGSKILSVSTLRGIDAEIIEFFVDPGSTAAGERVMDLEFPREALIGAIKHHGSVTVAEGQTKIYAGDSVVVFCSSDVEEKVEQLFKGSGN